LLLLVCRDTSRPDPALAAKSLRARGAAPPRAVSGRAVEAGRHGADGADVGVVHGDEVQRPALITAPPFSAPCCSTG